MNHTDEARAILRSLKTIFGSITGAVAIYLVLGFAMVAGYFQGLHLPLIKVAPDLLQWLSIGGAVIGAGLIGGAIQWERMSLAPQQLIHIKGRQAVQALVMRTYIAQALMLEMVAVIGLVLLLAGLSYTFFLAFTCVPMLLLGLKLAHIDDLLPTLEQLLH